VKNRSLISLLLSFCLLSVPQAFALHLEVGEAEGKFNMMDGFKGREPSSEPFFKKFLTHDPKELWETKLVESQKLLKIFPDSFNSQILIPVAQIHLGRYSEALNSLTELKKSHPTSYLVAANLGMTYDLMGDNHSAFQWIKETVKLKEDSDRPEGTEWLHIKILEAKIARASDPDWFQSHSILGYNFGSDERPYEPREFNKDSELSEKTVKALIYHLHERMDLVKAPDEVVADLLFDLGNLAAIANWFNYAEHFYKLAAEYGYSKPILEKRKAYVSRQKSKDIPAEK
jgi:hypothetical protein